MTSVFHDPPADEPPRPVPARRSDYRRHVPVQTRRADTEVVETRCNDFAPLAFPESIGAGLRVARLGASSARDEVGLFAAGAETAAACGRFTHVDVDRATCRPTFLPQRWPTSRKP